MLLRAIAMVFVTSFISIVFVYLAPPWKMFTEFVLVHQARQARKEFVS